MKKLISIIFLLIVLFPKVNCFAVENAKVYAEKLYASSNSIVFVPVYIKNNPGIMGFKITLTYDSKVISYPNINRGTISKSGNMNDSIGVSNDGTIDIVWNSDAEIKDDGTLFVVSFNTGEVKTEETVIKLKYSQDDTFNEKYEDVKLDCNDITVSFKEKPKEDKSSESSAGRPANNEDIATAIDSVLEINKIKTVSDIDKAKQDDIVSQVNERIKQITGSNEKVFSNCDELKNTYESAVQDVYKKSVLECIDAADIENVINDALKSVDANSLDEITDKNAGAFTDAFEKGIKKLSPDVYDIVGKLSPDEVLKAINEIKKDIGKENVDENVANSKNVNLKKSYVFGITVIIIVLICLLLFRTLVINKNRRKTL